MRADGIPFYCCSLAYAIDYKLSSVVDAAIIDLVRGDLYYASKEKGAYLNGNKIAVMRHVNNGNAVERQGKDILLGMNIAGVSEDTINHVSKVISKASHTRHFGANALELCYFARGFMDAYVDIRGKIGGTGYGCSVFDCKRIRRKTILYYGFRVRFRTRSKFNNVISGSFR